MEVINGVAQRPRRFNFRVALKMGLSRHQSFSVTFQRLIMNAISSEEMMRVAALFGIDTSFAVALNCEIGSSFLKRW